MSLTDPNRLIIAISGRIGAGKDTLADHILADQLPGTKRALAYELKQLASRLFGIDPAVKDDICRRILQEFGVAMRRINPGVWIRQVMAFERSLPPGQVLIVPDVRFPNEAEHFWNMGAEVVRLEPADWDRYQERVMRQFGYSDTALFEHESETALAGREHLPLFTHVIRSDTVEEMTDAWDQYFTRLVKTRYRPAAPVPAVSVFTPPTIYGGPVGSAPGVNMKDYAVWLVNLEHDSGVRDALTVMQHDRGAYNLDAFRELERSTELPALVPALDAFGD